MPWPQKGPAVPLPLGSSAPISRVADAPTWTAHRAGLDTVVPDGTIATTSGTVYSSGSGNPAMSFDPHGGLIADLSTATASTINALRQAFQLQKLYERDARGGTRYTEIIKSHFGVTSPDARLQRPEYLGGGSQQINFTPIPQNSASETGSPQGNLAAMATMSASGHGFTKSFTEHSLILGFVNIRADLNYQQGLNRMWSRRTRWDFYWPALSHIGEQAVLNKEIYAQGNTVFIDTDIADDVAFGYQERFAEYRYKPSTITGQFRSTFAQSLDIWHLAQEFESLPELTSEFIVDNPPVDRVIAVTAEGYPQFLLDVYFQFKTARPMPTYSVPGLIDHF